MKPKTLSIPRCSLWVVEGSEHQNARSAEVQSPWILLQGSLRTPAGFDSRTLE